MCNFVFFFLCIMFILEAKIFFYTILFGLYRLKTIFVQSITLFLFKGVNILIVLFLESSKYSLLRLPKITKL